jgi:hypothetical protein
MVADEREALWQASRNGNMAAQRALLAKLSKMAITVRPGQTQPQIPLRITRTCLSGPEVRLQLQHVHKQAMHHRRATPQSHVLCLVVFPL